MNNPTDLIETKVNGDIKKSFSFNHSDGNTYLLKPLVPEDKFLFQKGFEKLSSQSKVMRFLTTKNSITEKELNFLVSPDFVSHLAFGIAHRVSNILEPVGVIRLIVHPNETDKAELAITILDEYQNRGLSSVILKTLSDICRQLGVKVIQADVFAENLKVLSLFKKFGTITKRDCSRGVLSVDLLLN